MSKLCNIFGFILFIYKIDSLEDVKTNFSPAFHRHMLGQAKEIARKCVEPPLKKKPNEPPFKPSPSLKKSVDFLIDCVKRLPLENCQFCGKICFSSDPKVILLNICLQIIFF